ncbi:MAG: hypothetical protein AAGA56_16930 [Myxococcota bacterium]
MREFIVEAGWGIYPVVAFGVAAVIVSLRTILRPDPKGRITAAWLIGLTLVAGAFGTVTGLQASARYIDATPDKWLFVVGLRESLNNMVAALLLIVVAMLGLFVAHLRRDGDGESPSAALGARQIT